MRRHTLVKLMRRSSPRITENYYVHVTEPHISSGCWHFIAYQARRPEKVEQECANRFENNLGTEHPANFLTYLESNRSPRRSQ